MTPNHALQRTRHGVVVAIVASRVPGRCAWVVRRLWPPSRKAPSDSARWTFAGASFVSLLGRGGHIIKGGKRHPDVGDEVTIYPNSTILGGKTFIGERTTIGANVFLMHSVPPDSLVVHEEKQLVVLDKKAKRQPTGVEYTI